VPGFAQFKAQKKIQQRFIYCEQPK